MISRGELKGRVLRFLNKTSKFKGFYADDKMNDAFQEAIDFIAIEMFEDGEGWTSDIWFIDTTANQVSVPIPDEIAMIKEVRYKIGDAYVPVVYDTDQGQPDTLKTQVSQFPSKYRIVDNAIFFNPPISDAGVEYLQIEGEKYPKYFQDDADIIPHQFSRAMWHFMKYKMASNLAYSTEKYSIPWKSEEVQWYGQMKKLVAKRVNKPTAIREFGY